MKLIVGLGNPGEKYENTRHNVGFWLIERLYTELNSVCGCDFKLFKNTNFVNECGKDIKKTIGLRKISLEDMLVIHDCFDLPLGHFKLQFNRGAAGHKGVQSIIDETGSKSFWRLRIGIGHPPEGVEADDYVIEKFSPPEQEILESLYPQIFTTVKDWVLKEEK